MSNRSLAAGVAAVLLCVLSPSVAGQAVPWQHLDGTTHWYEVVSVPAGITWTEAQTAAHARNGHLVTVTSTPERRQEEAWRRERVERREHTTVFGGIMDGREEGRSSIRGGASRGAMYRRGREERRTTPSTSQQHRRQGGGGRATPSTSQQHEGRGGGGRGVHR